jgi:PPM family protein phosphatase
MAAERATASVTKDPVDDGVLPDGWVRAELAALSTCGPVREQNEDRLGWGVIGSPSSFRSPGSDEPAGLAEIRGPGIAVLVADGLGGHSHGELASRTAIGLALRRLADSEAIGRPGPALRAAFEEANEACLAGRLFDPVAFDRSPAAFVAALPGAASAGDEAGRPDALGRNHGGQTTLTALALTGAGSHIAHVGDCRLFRLRDGELELLTNDHTQVRDLLRMRVIRPEQALTHPGRHLLTRSIGGDLVVRVDERGGAPSAGDAYLLCSDGIWSKVTGAEARSAMDGDLATGVADLVDRSVERGGDDNASVIALRVLELGGRPDAAAATAWRLPWRRGPAG